MSTETVGEGEVHLMHNRSTLGTMTPASVRFRDRAQGAITDQSDIACTDVEEQVRGTVRYSAIRVKGQPHASRNHL